jgi:LuxR family maltose regulon positive regulatory protein
MPPVSADLIHRPHLIERLNQGLNRSSRVTLISAPAGYGKTTLAAAWLQDSPQPVAWLSLDEQDSDLVVFVDYFIAAIRTLFPEACPLTQGLCHAPQLPPLDFVATTLINEIADIRTSFFLVLDDYHAIQAEAIHQILSKLIEYLPWQMHVVIASRIDPPLLITRLRARQHITEIRAPELSFSRGEVRAYVQRALGEQVSRATADLLHQKTEGWIASICLVVFSMHASDNPMASVESIRGVDRYVMDYLVEEVLARQPPAMLDFLLKTSLLDRLCGPLCDAVADIADPVRNSQSYLEWLEQANLFVMPLDNERKWYRYHHLFRELLYNRLKQQAGDEDLATLHVKASVWLADNGFISQALQHALSAANVPQAAKLVEQHRLELLNREDWHTLEKWLNNLPEEIVSQRPALLLSRAWIMGYHFQLAEMVPILEQAEQRLDRGDVALSDRDDRALRGEIDALRSGIWATLYNDTQYTIECAERALKSLPATHRAHSRGCSHVERGHQKCLTSDPLQSADISDFGLCSLFLR